MITEISSDVTCAMPTDVRTALLSDEFAFEKWEDLTPHPRNE
jgi:hypothetical protein